MQCSFPLLNHFSCVSLMSFPQEAFPVTPDQMSYPIILSSLHSLSEHSLQFLLNVYLDDCLLNACLFYLTIWLAGVGRPCVVYCPIPRACHGVWHIVGANLLNELIKKKKPINPWPGGLAGRSFIQYIKCSRV